MALQRFPNIKSVYVLVVSTLLDPRFKKVAFSSTASIDEAQRRLISEITIVSSTSADGEDQQSRQTSDNSVGINYNQEPWKSFDDKVTASCDRCDFKTEALVECQEFFKEQKIPRTSDPINWWKANASQFPTLQRPARKYLCVPATSVPSEKLF